MKKTAGGAAEMFELTRAKSEAVPLISSRLPVPRFAGRDGPKTSAYWLALSVGLPVTPCILMCSVLRSPAGNSRPMSCAGSERAPWSSRSAASAPSVRMRNRSRSRSRRLSETGPEESSERRPAAARIPILKPSMRSSTEWTLAVLKLAPAEPRPGKWCALLPPITCQANLSEPPAGRMYRLCAGIDGGDRVRHEIRPADPAGGNERPLEPVVGQADRHIAVGGKIDDEHGATRANGPQDRANHAHRDRRTFVRGWGLVLRRIAGQDDKRVARRTVRPRLGRMGIDDLAVADFRRQAVARSTRSGHDHVARSPRGGTGSGRHVDELDFANDGAVAQRHEVAFESRRDAQCRFGAHLEPDRQAIHDLHHAVALEERAVRHHQGSSDCVISTQDVDVTMGIPRIERCHEFVRIAHADHRRRSAMRRRNRPGQCDDERRQSWQPERYGHGVPGHAQNW